MTLALEDDLTGVGVNFVLAGVIGATVKLIAGVGTTQTGAAVVTSQCVELNPSGGATAFVIPSIAAIMDVYYITNQQSTTGTVFVPSGHTISATANGSVTCAQGASVLLWQYKPKNWCSK